MTDIPVIIDNGAYTAKVGLATQEEPNVIPNCIMKAKAERRRAFVGNQINECRDASGLFYILCFQRGYLLNWDVQKNVWDHIFSDEGTNISLEDRNVVITEPQFNFPSIQEAMMEILFEEYHCAGICKTTTADLAAYNYCDEGEELMIEALNCIVVDVGYSFTHIIPFIRGKRYLSGIRRVDIGGKVLTNHLKEIISYRHLNVMDESYVVNQVKEDICFVSENFYEDMNVHKDPLKRSKIVVDYVLPDFTNVKRGYIRGLKEARDDEKENDNGNIKAKTVTNGEERDQQVIRLCNERFTVPELLFNPSDVGIQQMGVADALIDCLRDMPTYTHASLLKNIILMGGSAQFPGFKNRLQNEIRAMAPDDLEVSVYYPNDPVGYAWYGGKALTKDPDFQEYLVSREDFEENGYYVSDGK